MASISLRAYNREIESLIDQGQAEEAIAHCMHILQSVPKNIASYRLLGKALLELRRYTDAVDIFQRVLSSVPDDFVSHVGMSIIRENEKNLDASIWHMERAYEAQPANAAIQDELRRLYGRRDGMEPPKIRLTRGALARMYAKGHLYPQAIGELSAALAEDPQRPDLQVILALMYHQAGQREQAVKSCSDILKKLPYCLEANRILADLLPGGGIGRDSQSYYQRLVSLEPYYGKIEPSATSIERVQDNAVMVEKLNYQSGQRMLGTGAQPAWNSGLGGAFQPPAEGTQPDWQFDQEESGTAKPFGESVAPFGEETLPEPGWGSALQSEPEVEGSTEELIPDFLKDAGWTPSDRTADEIAMEELKKEQEAQMGEEIARAEIPDWLRDMAPEGVLDQAGGESEGEVLPWLQETEPGPTDSVVTWLQETKQPATEEEVQDVQAALQAASMPKGEPLPDRITEEPLAVEAGSEPGPDWDLEKDLPEWLRTTEQEPSGVTSDLPGWLVEKLEAAGPPTAPEQAAPGMPEPTFEDETLVPTGDETLSWSQAQEETSKQPTIEEVMPSEAIPAWLQELAEEQEAGEAAPETGVVEEGELAPEEAWYKTPTAGLAKAAETAAPADEIPEWLQAAPEEAEAEAPVGEMDAERTALWTGTQPEAPSEAVKGLPLEWMEEEPAVHLSGMGAARQRRST